MRPTRLLVLALVTAGALLMAACGNDAEALSKPEFIEQANAICQASQDEAEPLFDAVFADLEDIDFDDPANEGLLFTRFAEAMQEVEPIFERQLDDIRALEPPAEDKELIEELIADQEEALTRFVTTLDAAAAGDEAARAAVDGDEDPFDDVDRRAREYGLTVCGDQE